MLNQQILDYIKKSYEAGISLEECKNNLIKAGWSILEINEAITYYKTNSISDFNNLVSKIPPPPAELLEKKKDDSNQNKSNSMDSNLKHNDDTLPNDFSFTNGGIGRIIFPVVVLSIFIILMGYSYYTGEISLPSSNGSKAEHDKESSHSEKEEVNESTDNLVTGDYSIEDLLKEQDNRTNSSDIFKEFNYSLNPPNDDGGQNVNLTKDECDLHSNTLNVNLSIGTSKGLFISGFNDVADKVVWTVDNTLVASVLPESGSFSTVTGLSPGFTIVTATDLSVGEYCNYKIGVYISSE